VTETAAPVATPWQLDRGPRAKEMGYLPGLDGVRALAVIGVLLYHADLSWIPGGFLGVDVFFVLSGFLITSLILEEFDRSGRVDFRRFYLGRARRLLPALILVLVVVSLAAALVYQDAARQLASDVVASIFYVNNWWYIAADQSYFEFIGRPPLLKHLWSLAVEEQFYLVWPAIAFLAMRRFARKGVFAVAATLAILSTIWMLQLAVANGFPDFADPSRAYFGTDSHSMGLLIGAAMATFWRPGRMRRSLPTGASVIITAIGITALLAVIWFFVFVGEFTPWLYRGGFLGLALIVATLIAAASHPGVGLGKAMGTQPWRYIGQRSYGLYLWHWPVFMATRPGLDLPLDGVPLLILRLVLTVGFAELSFRFVEMPIRRGAIQRYAARVKAASGARRRRLRLVATAMIGATVVSVVAVALLLAATTRTAGETVVAADVAAAMGIASGGPTEVSLDDGSEGQAVLPSAASSAGAGAGASASSPGASSPTPAATPTRDTGTVSAIGDSVMLGARSVLKDVIPGTRVDAAVSRYPGAFIGKLKRYVAGNRLAPIVVLHPGTNGVLPESMMREMLDILVDSPRVVVVNTNMPRTWREPNNNVMADVVPEYPNAVLADWRAASLDQPEYFASDGIHLTEKGAKAYANLIKQAAGL
jgi:peptidoglycan/LPS O-acetylase OafA/YrhL